MECEYELNTFILWERGITAHLYIYIYLGPIRIIPQDKSNFSILTTLV